MKNRNGFVSNSSSSSFIIGFKGEPTVDALLEKDPFKHWSNFAIESWDEDYKTQHYVLMTSREMAEFFIVHIENQVQQVSTVTKSELWEDIYHRFDYYDPFNMCFNNFVPFDTYFEELKRKIRDRRTMKEVEVEVKAYALMGLDAPVKTEKDEYGEHKHIGWQWASTVPFNKYMDGKIDPSDEESESWRELVERLFNNWWEENVGENGTCYSVEIGDSHGIRNAGIEKLPAFRDIGSDIIVLSNH